MAVLIYLLLHQRVPVIVILIIFACDGFHLRTKDPLLSIGRIVISENSFINLKVFAIFTRLVTKRGDLQSNIGT